ncbi:MAG: diguanylate cyclase [Defluviitaleaceae bacterium]|nr:diguanylate cyclase [Defluviitaleaceae bacterium]
MFTVVSIMNVFFAKRRWPLPVTVASYAAYFASGAVLFLTLQTPILNVASSIIFLILITMNYESPMWKRFAAAFGVFAIMTAVEGLFTAIHALYLGDMMAQTAIAEVGGVFDFLIMGSLVFVVGLLVRRFKNISKNAISTPLFWVTSITVPVGSLVLFFLLPQYLPLVWAIVGVAVVALINALTFLIHDALSASYEAKMQAQIQTSERMQIMLDSSPLACAIINEDLAVVEVNQRTALLFQIDDPMEFAKNRRVFSPEFQTDGRDSYEKSVELHKLAFERGYLNFEWMHQTKDGEAIPCEVTIKRVTLQDDKHMVIRYIHDLREIKTLVDMKDHLENLAFTDSLTGLYNRRYFMQAAEEAFDKCENENQSFSIIMMDIDFFKQVNDSYGHVVGDEVLSIFGKRMSGVLSQDTVAARYGGEEFIILLTNMDKESVLNVADRVHKSISSEPFVVNGMSLPITASVGVATKTDEQKNLLSVIDAADMAVYKSKTGGRNLIIAG